MRSLISSGGSILIQELFALAVTFGERIDSPVDIPTPGDATGTIPGRLERHQISG